MPEILPGLLAPYLQAALSHSSCTSITSTLSTSANWVIVRLLYVALKGVNEGTLPTFTKQHVSIANANVIFVSLTRPLELWTELCKKVGLELPSLLKSKSVHYIDGLTTASPDIAGHASSGLKALTFDALCEVIYSVAHATPGGASRDDYGETVTSRPTIIIDGIDFLAACQPGVDIVTIHSCLLKLRSLASALVLTASADAPLIHNQHGSATPLEQVHATLVTSLAHQSEWVMQLRGLDTGSARDVTGVLRVSKGGAYEDEKDQDALLDEAEWLYQVKGDGTARIWSRGE